jgi:hypothetical protein
MRSFVTSAWAFESRDDVLRWVDPWWERAWKEPSEAGESHILISQRKKPGAL